MLVVLAPMVLVFSLGFGAIGMVVGMLPFVLLGAAGTLVGLCGLLQAAVRSARARHLRRTGVRVLLRPESVKLNTYINLSRAFVLEVFCVGIDPPDYSGHTFRTHLFHDTADAFTMKLPDQLVAWVDPRHPTRYSIDLSPYNVPASRLPKFKTIAFALALFAFGIFTTFAMARHTGTGMSGIAPVAVTGKVDVALSPAASAEGANSWSVTPNACTSGVPTGFYGVTLRDSSQNADNAVTLVRDKVNGDFLDADLPGTGHDARFFAVDCPGQKIELEQMDSVVNRVTNLKGSVNADCRNSAGELHAHVTFQFCH